ncbi:aminoglycoside phosphotransferase family protein [Phenylobacterium sp.]|uniref:phosphotransferase family protein n=1 Tax=Phenylobacterium sp. TaxID=1871053 RepID=UPI0030F3B4B2
MAEPTSPPPRETIDFDLAAAQAVLDRLDAPLQALAVRRLAGGSKDVFEIDVPGQTLVLKPYPPASAWASRKEAYVGGLIGRVLDAPVPLWLAVDESLAVLPHVYALITRLPGRTLLSRNGKPEAEGLYRQMGALLRTIHTIPMSRFGYILDAETVVHAQLTNRDYLTKGFQAKFRDFRAHGGDAALAARMERLVGESGDLMDACHAPVLCHYDYHPGNLLADQSPDGEWRVSGLLDFENAMAGDPLYDLAKALDFSAHDDPASRAPLLEGYGAIERPHLAETLVIYRLYHKLEMWNFFQALGKARDASGAAGLLRDLDELTPP